MTLRVVFPAGICSSPRVIVIARRLFARSRVHRGNTQKLRRWKDDIEFVLLHCDPRAGNCRFRYLDAQVHGACPCGSLSWNNALGGSAATASNWNPVQIPTTVDDLTFNLGGSYSVTWDAAVANSRTHTYRQGTVTHTISSPHTVSTGITVGNLAVPRLAVIDQVSGPLQACPSRAGPVVALSSIRQIRTPIAQSSR